MTYMNARHIFLAIVKKIKRLIKPIKPNTIENNLQMWSEWDWTNYGEEWSNFPLWKDSLVENVLIPYVPINSRILEIGPGAGRWTEYLIQRAQRIILVDLTQKCIDICRKRFSNQSNIEYFINDGKDLSFISSASIDRIWSWDVFVHIQSDVVSDYVKQFSRILTPGGQGIIHHSKNGQSEIGWRSDMTSEKMRLYCKENGLNILNQFDSWGDNIQIWPYLPADEGPDIITVFEKPL